VDRDWVVYWMIASRRTHRNFGLQRAVEHARALGKPLVVLEALRCGYEWASDRLHAFVLQGMRDNRAAFERSGVLYYPYVEPHQGHGSGLLMALAGHAAVVVTDDFPAFFLPRMIAAAAARVDTCLEAVDSNGLLPMRATDRVFPTAFSFRAYLQKQLALHLSDFPIEDPIAGASLPKPRPLPAALTRRWPPASERLLSASPGALSALPIDHDVPVTPTEGGTRAAQAAMATFLRDRLLRYQDDRAQPEIEGTSGLSPYLHFGHVSVYDVFAALMTQERWTRRKLGPSAGGKREGWWNTSRSAEAFLDELVTWREVGYNMCALREDYDQYGSLPDWARATLEAHARDRRASLYTPAQFEEATTHDPLWNAAQRQLVCEGRLHNYLRMLWGKKILEWSPTPQQALKTMIHLNNKYGLDGRNPNSYSGIFWCLGRYDRPWGPARPVYGTVRYMSSENTARKVSVKQFLRRYAPVPARTLFD
jgi:deoxyribodipyrimidine photo-lyase